MTGGTGCRTGHLQAQPLYQLLRPRVGRPGNDSCGHFTPPTHPRLLPPSHPHPLGVPQWVLGLTVLEITPGGEWGQDPQASVACPKSHSPQACRGPGPP